MGYRLEDATRTLTVSSATPTRAPGPRSRTTRTASWWAKVGEDEQTRLAGAQFRLDRLVGGQVVETISVVDNSGRDTDADTGEPSERLCPPVAGHRDAGAVRLQGAPAQTFTVDSTDHTVTFSFVNTENGQATWRKVNEFGDVLEGAGFTLRLGGQSLVVTDNTGVPGTWAWTPARSRGTSRSAGWTSEPGPSPRPVPPARRRDAETSTVTAQTPLVDIGDIVNTQDGQVRWTKVDEEARRWPAPSSPSPSTTGRRSPSWTTPVTPATRVRHRHPDRHFAVRELDFGTWTLTESVAPARLHRARQTR